MTQKLPSILIGHTTDPRTYAKRDALRTLPVHSHFLGVGASGSGKGTASLILNLLSYRGGCFVFDPKGELTHMTARWRERELGHRIVVIDPFGQVDRRYYEKLSLAEQKAFPPIPTSSWNALEGLDESSPDYIDRLTDLAEGVIKKTTREPYWDDRAKTLFKGLCAAAAETGEPSLRTVRRYLNMPYVQWSDLLLGAARGDDGRRDPPTLLDPARYAFQSLASFSDRSREVLSVIANLSTHLAFLEHPAILDALDTPPAAKRFSLGDLARQPMTVYLVLPPEKANGHYGRLVRMILQRALNEVMAANQPDTKLLFMIDECGSVVGHLDAIETAFGLARGLGVSLLPYYQDLNQLKRDYPDSWQTFIANCTGEIYFAVNDHMTASHVSDLWGETEVYKPSLSLAGGGGGSVSAQLQRQYRPEEIMQITQGPFSNGTRIDPVMLLRTAGRFEILRPAHYYAIPTLKARAAPDPYHR